MNSLLMQRPTPLPLVILTGNTQRVWEKALRRLGRLSFAEIRDELRISMSQVQEALTVLAGHGLVTIQIEDEVTVVIPRPV